MLVIRKGLACQSSLLEQKSGHFWMQINMKRVLGVNTPRRMRIVGLEQIRNQSIR